MTSLSPPGTMTAVAVNTLSRIARLIEMSRATETLCLLDWPQIGRYLFDAITDAAVNDGLLDDETEFPRRLPKEF